MLNICCLCPTYGRPTLVSNALAMFESQHYPKDNCRMLVLDDGDQINGEGPTWKVISVADRYPSYCYKYKVLADHAMTAFQGWKPDAFALFEDDDVYGPFYLLTHNNALHTRQWSHPRQVYSLYGRNTLKEELPITEPSGGRFWSSAAIKVDFLNNLGGFITSGRADADQLNLAKWQYAGGDPGHPDDYYGIQWIYGWGRAFHCSGLMTDGAADTSWYLRHRKTETHRVDNITPRMDPQTAWLYRQLWCKICDNDSCYCRKV